MSIKLHMEVKKLTSEALSMSDQITELNVTLDSLIERVTRMENRAKPGPKPKLKESDVI